jgi:hypothetical protein
MSTGRYWIDHDGLRVEVELVERDGARVARLLVDDARQAEQ